LFVPKCCSFFAYFLFDTVSCRAGPPPGDSVAGFPDRFTQESIMPMSKFTPFPLPVLVLASVAAALVVATQAASAAAPEEEKRAIAAAASPVPTNKTERVSQGHHRLPPMKAREPDIPSKPQGVVQSLKQK
jgi:hypothetical protein